MGAVDYQPSDAILGPAVAVTLQHRTGVMLPAFLVAVAPAAVALFAMAAWLPARAPRQAANARH